MCQQPEHLFDFYYRIGETQFVFAAPRWNDEYTEHAIYADSFYWAPSLATFRRMVSCEIVAAEKDDGITRPLPEDLKLAPDCVNFEAISRFTAANPHLHW